MGIILWGESSAEVEDFIELFGTDRKFEIEKIFIAKRGIGNNYLTGIYYPYDITKKACIDNEFHAPQSIINLVQWCSPDIIISKNDKPIISIETTYHILTYNNIAQRIPRQIKSSTSKVPNVIFQKVDKLEKKDLLIWFTKVFSKASIIYNTPTLAILFDESKFNEKRNQFIELCNALINDRNHEKIISDIMNDMKQYSDLFDIKIILFSKNGEKRNWIKVDEDYVNIIPGVKPDRSGWKTKGTGLMDPYPGLVKLGEILFCYNDTGKRIRKLRTYFKYLPRNFWWFVKFPNEIYYKIIKEFSDDVKYKGEYDD